MRGGHVRLSFALAVFLGALGLQAAGEKSAVPAKPDDRTIAHVLNRIGFGPAPGDIARVRQLGLEAYIEQQLQPGRIADPDMAPRLARLQTVTKSTRELAEAYFVPALIARRQQQQLAGQDPAMTAPAGQNRAVMEAPEQSPIRAQRQVLVELSEQKIMRAAYSERQLEEVMVDFWFNHFNVFAGKGQTRVYLTEYERDAIRPHVLGRFRDLLEATAKSPAMLFYLDNWQSAAPAGTGMAPRNRQPRRLPTTSPTRSRGLNENYARELMELHTLGVDGGYSQKDVQEVARAFTGWTIANPRLGGPFTFVPRMHDTGTKTVLRHSIKAGGGQKDGERVLDILAGHPSTARHIATKLVRRFIADEPPAGLVDRAATRFLETGGDIRDVLRTILKSPEFFAPSSYRAKIKSPFEFVVSAVRATRSETANATALVQSLRDLGMPLYGCQPPTGYGDTAQDWVNTGALLNRMNFALALASGRMRGIRLPESSAATPSGAAVISAEILAGDVSESTSATVAKGNNPAQAIALILGSPDFQKR
jgi:uncharacterized protein (DUF1800 family)